MYACERCGKGLQVGMNVSHSHRRTKKRNYPNLHKVTLTISDKRKTMWLCTKCLRMVKKQATFTPKEIAEEPIVEAKVEVKATQSRTLSEDIEKAAAKEVKEPAVVAEAKPKS